jgi:excisionase family DNA binding protein
MIVENEIQTLYDGIEQLKQRVAKLEEGVPAYFDTARAAKYICVSAWTIRELAKDERIAYTRIGEGPKAPYIFARADLDEFIKKRRVNRYVSRLETE